MSLVYDKTKMGDPLDNLDYALDGSAGDLQFVSTIGNGMILNRDKKTPTESKDKAVLIVDISYNSQLILNRKEFCITRLKNYGDRYTIPADDQIAPVTINDLNGYQLTASNLSEPSEEMVQIILFPDGGGYYLMVGTYLKNEPNAKDDILKVMNTFRRK